MFYLLKYLGFIFSLLPDYLLQKIIIILRILFFDVLRVRRDLALSNIRLAMGQVEGEAKIIAIGRKSYESFLTTLIEFWRSWRRPMTTKITFQNRDYLDDALSEGRGAYLLCAHQGNWEAMGASISRFIHPTHTIVKKINFAAVQKFVAETRKKNGFITIQRQAKLDGLRSIFRVLRQNEIVGFVHDQYRPGEPRIPFFGQPARTNTSLATIWERHPAPIIPVSITRTKIGEHNVRFFASVGMHEDHDRKIRIQKNTLKFNHILEEMIRARPEQYFWLHNRWK